LLIKVPFKTNCLIEWNKNSKGIFSETSQEHYDFGYGFWAGLLFWAVKTSWHPILIAISGLALFLAIISWCKLKAFKSLRDD
jgi:cytochrome b subunit of formate dehydrogenase